jgi:hypothetical protein
MAALQDDPERKREYLELATIWRLIAKESEETVALFNFDAIALSSVRLAPIATHKPVGAVAYSENRKASAN